MSEEGVTLEFLARQLRRVIDDIASLKDDMGVLTAMVVRRDQEFGRLNAKLDDMFNQMRAMVGQHQRFSERLCA
jgi:methyl-accepting chemotaxis protein